MPGSTSFWFSGRKVLRRNRFSRAQVALAALVLAFVVQACNNTKPTKLGKAYQSFISLFNGYYHAETRYKEAIRSIQRAYSVPVQEDEFISVLDLPAADKAQANTQLLDQAIEKCDLIIFRRKQSSYQDDCFFLKGRCWFYKNNTAEAMANFTYVLDVFPKSKLKPEVLYWMALTNIATGNDYGAEEIGRKLSKTKTEDKRVKGDIGLLQATLLVREKKYSDAISVLNKILPLLKGADKPARAHFLLAQLYDKNGAFAQAVYHYTEAAKRTLNNELVFRSKLNTVKLYLKYQPQDSNNELVTKTLKNLMRDGKYATFRDQVYYLYALQELKGKNYDGALKYLKLALANGGTNTNQKVLAYYKVGEILFYQKRDYVGAQAYYDSAATIVPKEFPQYAEIKAVSKTLNAFVEAKRTIQRNDSLLALSLLSEGELDRYVTGLIQREDQAKAAAEAERQRERQAQENLLLSQGRTTDVVAQPAAAGFYFDNQVSVSNGRLEFARVWGSRKNEDNWRRKNKDVEFSTTEGSAEAAGEDTARKSKNIAVRKSAYKKDIPRTEGARDTSRTQIAEAILKLASLFGNELNNPDSAMVYYALYLKRFPKGAEEPRAWYALHNIHSARFQKKDADRYKKLILDNYPGSRYARLVMREVVQDESEETKADYLSSYDALVDMHTKGDHSTVLSFSGFLLTRFQTTKDLPRILYIRALSHGYLNDKDSMRAILKHIVDNFPGEEVTEQAKYLLQRLDNPTADPSELTASREVFDPNDPNQTYRPGTQRQPNQPPKPPGSSRPPTPIPQPTNPNPPKPGTPPAGTPNPSTPQNPAPNPAPNPANPAPSTPAGGTDARFKGFQVARQNNEPVIGILLVPKEKIQTAELQAKVADFHNKYFKSDNLRVSVLLYNNTHHLVFVTQFVNYFNADNYLKFLRKEQGLMELTANPQKDSFFCSSSNFRLAFSQKRFADFADFFLTNELEFVKTETPR